MDVDAIAVVGVLGLFLGSFLFGPLLYAMWRLLGIVRGRDRTSESAQESTSCAARQARSLRIIRSIYLGYAALAITASWLFHREGIAEQESAAALQLARNQVKVMIYQAGTKSRVLKLENVNVVDDERGQAALLKTCIDGQWCEAKVFFDHRGRVSGVVVQKLLEL